MKRVILAAFLLFLSKENFHAQTIAAPLDLHVRITNVVPGKKDTLWLSLDGGKNLGLKEGLKGYGVQVYNTKKNRNYKLLKTLTVTNAAAQTAKAFILLPTGESDTSYLLKNDQAYFPELLKSGGSDLFKPLAALGIRFVNQQDELFYQQDSVINLGTQITDKTLLEKLKSDIVTSAEWLAKMDNKPAAWTSPQTGGRYKGIGVLDAMMKASVVDVEAFLRFVLDFPGKYLGNEWRINETFATWVINNTPPSTSQSFLSNTFSRVEDDDMAKWAVENNYYADSIKTYVASAISKKIDRGKSDSAQLLIKKAALYAKALNDKIFESEVLTYEARLMSLNPGDEARSQAIGLYTKAIELNSKNGNAYWYRGNLYADEERYAAAINDMKTVNELYPAFASAWGNAGWWYLKQFKVADAGTLVKKAYELDSFTVAWSVNMGHYHLLTNNAEEARRLYQKTLDNLTSELEFYQGPLADFDIFAKSGMFQEALTRERTWMLNEYNQTYKHYVQADSLFNLAKSFKNNKDYAKAASYYAKSLEAEKAAKKPRLLSIHNITTWVAYCQALNKEYAAAEKNYLLALEMARKQKLYNSIANDLDLLSDLYNTSGQKALSESYKAESIAYGQRMEDEQGTGEKNLFIVAVGIDKYKDVQYKWAAADAVKLTNELKKKARQFNNVYTYLLTNEHSTADSVERAMQAVIAKATKGDTFVFYFTGKGTTGGSESFLLPWGFTEYTNDSLLRAKAVSASLMRSWSNNIKARRQFYLTDAATTYFPSSFASQLAQANPGHVLQKDIVFLSATFPRIEKEESKSSVVASSFMNLLAQANDQPDKVLTAKRLENHFAEEITRNNHYLSMESFSQGRDFVLANFDQASLKSQAVDATNKWLGRGADEINGGMQAKNASIGRRYGLFIATDNYDDPKWGGLNNPTKDATELKKELEANYGFEIEVLANPSRKQIMDKLNEYSRKNFEKNDQLILLFSGHGYFDAVGNEGYLIPKDAQWTDRYYDFNYYSFSTLVKDIKKIKTEHMLLLLDACHAGAICDNALLRGDGGLYDKLPKLERIKNHLENPNRVIITSGRKDQRVYDGIDGKNSPFIVSILNGLRSSQAKSTGTLSFHQLMEYIREMQKTQATVGKLFPSDNDEFLLEYIPAQAKYKTDSLKQ